MRMHLRQTILALLAGLLIVAAAALVVQPSLAAALTTATPVAFAIVL